MPKRYSYRDFGIGTFKKEFEECSSKKHSYLCQADVRGEYRQVESGRFHKMADKIHGFICALDKDEVEQFKKDAPNAVRIANEFATIEELRKFNGG